MLYDMLDYKYLIFTLAITMVTIISSPIVYAENFEITNNFPEIPLSVGEMEISLPGSTYESWVSLRFSLHTSNTSTSLANVEYCSHPICLWEISERNRHRQIIVRDVIVNTQPIRQYLQTLKETTRREPENARFLYNEDARRVDVFSPGKNGYEIDIDATEPILRKSMQSASTSKDSNAEQIVVDLPLAILSAKTHSEDAEQFGITTLIGEGRSDFSGSSGDRMYNIRFAMEKFHGTLIAPGEEFSFVDILGEVDEERGWRPELVIRNNRTEPEYGGGICQVSTTLFRAAVYSGLRITMRQNHSYPVKYYQPIGFDASVYVPMPDLRFINNTPGHILVQGFIEKNELVFRLYGTDDERSVSITEPVVLEKRDNGSMRTVFTQTVTTKDGETFLEKSFFSDYDNPDNYPKPEDIDLTEKPKDWSKRQWEAYKKEIESYLESR
jgi:vancomycin resistance protein YoaR